MYTTIRTSTLLVTLLALAACGRDSGEPASDMPAADTAPLAAAEQDATGAAMTRSPAPADARVFFVTPGDGDVVSNPVTVEFGVTGMDVVPAGTAAANSGHHHLLIDTGLPAPDRPVPADARHVHFGDGSTSTELTLAPGEHTLQLLFADHLHVPHDPPVYSDPITVTVE